LNCHHGGEVFFRHNAILRKFAHIIRSTGDLVQLEVPASHVPVFGSGGRDLQSRNLRFDLLITSSASAIYKTADVTIVNPISSSPQVLRQNAHTSGNACRLADHRKQAIYSRTCAALGLAFLPLSVEVFGRLGPCAEAMLQECAQKVIVNDFNLDRSTNNKLHSSLIHQWKMQLSCILQRANSLIIRQRGHRRNMAHLLTGPPPSDSLLYQEPLFQ
jgi:hypothetical protein